MSSIGDKLVQYCDAYYPIVYIDTYEDAKTDSIIAEAFKRGYLRGMRQADSRR